MEESSEFAGLLYLFFRIAGSVYGIDSRYVREVVPLSTVTPIPRTPPHIRGVINLRGRVLPIIDTRVLLKLDSLDVECEKLTELMHQREQDHRNWLKELEACVDEKREFRLATDPHKCAFGKWYDSFTTDNGALNLQLMKFDQPHQAIHGIAHKVIGLVHDGNPEAAKREIARTRNTTLAAMIRLFEEFRSAIRNMQRELVIMARVNETEFGLTADSADTVEVMTDIERPNVEAAASTEQDLIAGVGKRERDKSLALVLDGPAVASILTQNG